MLYYRAFRGRKVQKEGVENRFERIKNTFVGVIAVFCHRFEVSPKSTGQKIGHRNSFRGIKNTSKGVITSAYPRYALVSIFHGYFWIFMPKTQFCFRVSIHFPTSSKPLSTCNERHSRASSHRPIYSIIVSRNRWVFRQKAGQNKSFMVRSKSRTTSPLPHKKSKQPQEHPHKKSLLFFMLQNQHKTPLFLARCKRLQNDRRTGKKWTKNWRTTTPVIATNFLLARRRLRQYQDASRKWHRCCRSVQPRM